MKRLAKIKTLLLTLILIVTAFLFGGCMSVESEEGTGKDSGVQSSVQTEAQSETQSETEESKQTTDEKETISTEATKSTQKATTKPTKEQTQKATTKPTKEQTTKAAIDKNGTYNSKEDVALYIHTYGCLPKNYITKAEAKKLGWTGGSVEKYAKGKAIGGDNFGNYEGLLPKKNGRKYTECDIDTIGKNSRGAKRIIFSNDGLVYYTDDHYESFTLLYGKE